MAAAERVGCNGAGGEEEEGVEDLLVEAGGVAERLVTVLDRGGEASAQSRVVADVALEVGEAEGDVAGLVLRGETGDVGGDRIGGGAVQEPEEREEAALAEDGQQEGGEREVRLVEEGLERGLAADGR